ATDGRRGSEALGSRRSGHRQGLARRPGPTLGITENRHDRPDEATAPDDVPRHASASSLSLVRRSREVCVCRTRRVRDVQVLAGPHVATRREDGEAVIAVLADRMGRVARVLCAWSTEHKSALRFGGGFVVGTALMSWTLLSAAPER